MCDYAPIEYDRSASSLLQRHDKTVPKHGPFLGPSYGPDFGPDPRTQIVHAQLIYGMKAYACCSCACALARALRFACVPTALARERASELACAFASERVPVQWVGYGLLCGMCQAFRGCSVTFGGAAITAFARASGAILEYCVGSVWFALRSFFLKKIT